MGEGEVEVVVDLALGFEGAGLGFCGAEGGKEDGGGWGEGFQAVGPFGAIGLDDGGEGWRCGGEVFARDGVDGGGW